MTLNHIIACLYIFFSEAKRSKTISGLVARKLVNVNPGLKVNRGINFSCIKVLSIVYVLCSLRLLMLKTEGQKM